MQTFHFKIFVRAFQIFFSLSNKSSELKVLSNAKYEQLSKCSKPDFYTLLLPLSSPQPWSRNQQTQPPLLQHESTPRSDIFKEEKPVGL